MPKELDRIDRTMQELEAMFDAEEGFVLSQIILVLPPQLARTQTKQIKFFKRFFFSNFLRFLATFLHSKLGFPTFYVTTLLWQKNGPRNRQIRKKTSQTCLRSERGKKYLVPFVFHNA